VSYNRLIDMEINRNRELNKIKITNASFNRMLGLLDDSSFKDLIKNLMPTLKPNSGGSRLENIKMAKTTIAEFLHTKKYPLVWLDPIFNMLIEKDSIDFPLDDGIGLRIAEVAITANNPAALNFYVYEEIPKVKKKISIEITGNVSTNRIVEFIKSNAYLINIYQKGLELPDTLDNKKPSGDTAYKIFDMKNKGMSFSEIAGSPEMEDLALIDENTIRTIYYRYLELLKTSK
jgi:hypothetical protein